MIQLQGLTRRDGDSLRAVAGRVGQQCNFCPNVPPIAMLPAFCLNVAAASTYARTRSHVVPMLARAPYNASIVAVQLLMHVSWFVRLLRRPRSPTSK